MKKKTEKKASTPAKPKATPKAKKAPKAKKPPKCAERLCKQAGISHGYCRVHYFKHWREIKDDEKVRAERRLNAYVDRLAKRYPNDYLEKIKEGIENEDLFKKTIEQLDLDADPDSEGETDREYLEKFARTIKSED